MVSDELKTSWGLFLPAIPFRKLVQIAMIQVWNSSNFYRSEHTHSHSMPTQFCTNPTLPPVQLLFSPLPTSSYVFTTAIRSLAVFTLLRQTKHATLLRLSVTLPSHHSHLGVLSPTGCCQGCTQIKPHQRHTPHYGFPHNWTTASYLPFFCALSHSHKPMTKYQSLVLLAHHSQQKRSSSRSIPSTHQTHTFFTTPHVSHLPLHPQGAPPAQPHAYQGL